MDPAETLRLADQAISNGQYYEAAELLAAYKTWRMADGFEPNGMTGPFQRGDGFSGWCNRRLREATGGVS